MNVDGSGKEKTPSRHNIKTKQKNENKNQHVKSKLHYISTTANELKRRKLLMDL